VDSSEARLYIPAPSGFGPLPFSRGVRIGNTFHLSGHIGFDPSTRMAPPEVDKEIHLMLSSVRETLAQASLTLADLVSVQIFCTDLSLFRVFNEIYSSYFKGNLPARAFIGAGSLLLGARFEMTGIAVKTST
jgi:2-iminobutanoate/2-iminopropanoate deaminase